MNKAFQEVREHIDRVVRSMTKSEYKAFLDELGAEVEAREACLEEELGEDEG